MSLLSLSTAANDPALLARIQACAHQEARENLAVSGGPFAAAVRAGDTTAPAVFTWPVALNSEEAYESAMANPDIPAPIGADPSVVTDAMILAAVQATWPAAWPPTS